MWRWNIDFLAVFFIAVVMFGFSKMDALDSIQIKNAVSLDSEVLSRIDYILNQ
jgi:hypothetical protein